MAVLKQLAREAWELRLQPVDSLSSDFSLHQERCSLLWMCVYIFFTLYFVHVVLCILPGILDGRFSLDIYFGILSSWAACLSSLVSVSSPCPSQLPVSQRESLFLNQKLSEQS